VAALGKSGLVEEALDDILILMACHGMLRANQSLAHPEIEALLRDLDQVDFSAHCPHGRPVMKRMTLGGIERMFKR
jgi:DNA mismatch repair protein MutL